MSVAFPQSASQPSDTGRTRWRPHPARKVPRCRCERVFIASGMRLFAHCPVSVDPARCAAPRVFPREPNSLLQANIIIDHRSQIDHSLLKLSNNGSPASLSHDFRGLALITSRVQASYVADGKVCTHIDWFYKVCCNLNRPRHSVTLQHPSPRRPPYHRPHCRQPTRRPR